MKIAIIGCGPSAIESALYFESLECGVSIFSDLVSVNDYENYISQVEEPMPTELGLSRLKVSNVASYIDDYLKPLTLDFEKRGLFRDCKISRVTKSHLSAFDQVEGKSRMADLFRVTFEMNAQKMIEEQAKLNDMAFNNISAESLVSLKRSIEMAEDFDLVIFAKDTCHRKTPIGIGFNPCLNEPYFNEEENFHSVIPVSLDANLKEVAIFGDANEVSAALLKMNSWQDIDGKSIVIISSDKNILKNLGKTNSNIVNQCCEKIKNEHENFLLEEETRLKDELQKWESLEDYERVKYPRPQMREPQIKFQPGMGAISIDRLDESKKFFITLEPIKDYSQFEEFLGVITISADAILNVNRVRLNTNALSGLNLNNAEIIEESILFKGEPGLFNISSTEVVFDFALLKKKLNIVMDEINKYFSRK